MKRNNLKLAISIIGILVSAIFLIMSISGFSALKKNEKKVGDISIEDAYNAMQDAGSDASSIASQAGNTVNEAFFQDSGEFMLGLSNLLKNTSETALDDAASSQAFYAFISIVALLGFAYILSLELEKPQNEESEEVVTSEVIVSEETEE